MYGMVFPSQAVIAQDDLMEAGDGQSQGRSSKRSASKKSSAAKSSGASSAMTEEESGVGFWLKTPSERNGNRQSSFRPSTRLSFA